MDYFEPHTLNSTGLF